MKRDLLQVVDIRETKAQRATREEKDRYVIIPRKTQRHLIIPPCRQPDSANLRGHLTCRRMTDYNTEGFASNSLSSATWTGDVFFPSRGNPSEFKRSRIRNQPQRNKKETEEKEERMGAGAATPRATLSSAVRGQNAVWTFK